MASIYDAVLEAATKLELRAFAPAALFVALNVAHSFASAPRRRGAKGGDSSSSLPRGSRRQSTYDCHPAFDAAAFSPVLNSLREHFSSASPGADVLEQTNAVLSRLEFTAENTLYAQSVCPDEINHEVGDITHLFGRELGEVFHLGGLAGVPFTGGTGFKAFSHHVPAGGNLFILLCPHVGVSMDGKFGEYQRAGQTACGAACGAAVGAFNIATEGRSSSFLTSARNDHQMCYLVNEMNERKEAIFKRAALKNASSISSGDQSSAAFHHHNCVQREIVHEIHGFSSVYLESIINTDFGEGKLAVLTGIQINIPHPFRDYFEPLSFKVYQKGKTPIDVFEEAFVRPRENK